jgi:hypothetical protein
MDRDLTNGAREAVEVMGAEATRDPGAFARALEELERRTPGAFGPRREPLSEKEVAARAVEAVREVRRELWDDLEPEGPQPSSEDVERWERSREERRKRETY